MHFFCSSCKLSFPYHIPRWHCDCGAYLKLNFTPTFTRDSIVKERNNMWRYDGLYPIAYEDISISFDEGLTPLLPIAYDDFPIHVKLDSLMPTGSFKDRGTVMALNYLKNHGVTYITEDSSGNAASSVAAYSALGGLNCAVYVPAGNSSGKITQAKALGAEVHPTQGTRDEVALAAQIHETSYAGHNWHPLFESGYKSVAYELWEQNDFSAPDYIFTPCGGGGLTMGLIEGFSDLLALGEIEHLPKIYPVQPENCNPIYRAFHGITETWTATPTIAEGTSIAKPIKLEEIVAGVKKCGGEMLTVSDAATLAALKSTWQKGIYLEPTSAIAFAGFLQMKEKLSKNDKVVVMVSGNGLKASDKIAELLA